MAQATAPILDSIERATSEGCGHQVAGCVQLKFRNSVIGVTAFLVPVLQARHRLEELETHMSLLRLFARYGYVPLMLIGINGCAVVWAAGISPWKVGVLLVTAVAVALLMERVLPYEASWNKSHGEAGKDVTHGFAYELSGLAGLLWLQPIALTVPWQGLWPREWPLGLQLLTAIIVTDLAVTLLHYASHHVSWLWKLHCVHHGVHRLYGFNGLVRHPLHQQLDLVVAVLPLVLLGMPFAVTVLLGLAMSVQLILQHSNVDYRLGPFRHVLAIGPTHRLHHVSWKDEGDVNFGLFSTMWDRLLGTFRASSQQLPAAGDIGLQDEPCYPQCYWAQLALPFRTFPIHWGRCAGWRDNDPQHSALCPGCGAARAWR
jgi:sterol desaturase/sphingolipid hydroxylase (fatty acid hydroxylase superfamily)